MNKIKVSDIKVKTRTLDELDKFYEEKYGIIKSKEKKREWNMSMVIIPYFHKLPKELIVEKETEIDTKLWYAKDFYNGKKKKIYQFVEISDKYQPPMIVAKDEDGIKRIFALETICIVPSASKSKKIKTDNELHEEYKGKKRLVRKEKKEKEIEKEEMNKKLNVPISKISKKAIIKKKSKTQKKKKK